MPWRKRQVRRTSRRTERRRSATPKPPKPSLYKIQEAHPKFFEPGTKRWFAGYSGEKYAIKWDKKLNSWILAIETGDAYDKGFMGGRRTSFYKIGPNYEMDWIDGDEVSIKKEWR